MILTPFNCGNPELWGKEIHFFNSEGVQSYKKLEIPNEYDFLQAWCGQDTENARKYYRM